MAATCGEIGYLLHAVIVVIEPLDEHRFRYQFTGEGFSKCKYPIQNQGQPECFVRPIDLPLVNSPPLRASGTSIFLHLSVLEVRQAQPRIPLQSLHFE
jgi:hypothetical protein